MKCFVTVCDNYGVSFNSRRQSSDVLLLEDMIAVTKDVKITVNFYTYQLFIYNNLDAHVTLKESENVFYECNDLSEIIDDVDELIVYFWNRSYPSDKKLKVNFDEFFLIEEFSFEGSSHSKVTRKIFKR